MDDLHDDSAQCTMCNKSFSTKQTFILHLGECSKTGEDAKNREVQDFVFEDVNNSDDLGIEEKDIVKVITDTGPNILKSDRIVTESETSSDFKVPKTESEVEETDSNAIIATDAEHDNDVKNTNSEALKDIDIDIDNIDSDTSVNNLAIASLSKLLVNNTEGVLENIRTTGKSFSRPIAKTTSDLPNLSTESIEITDSDEEVEKVAEETDNSEVSIDLTEDDEIESQITTVLPKQTDNKVKKNSSKKKGRLPFKPKPCTYCSEQCHDRIGLAKHLISDHWEAVRMKQGGGRIATYAQIEDSRIIRPKPMSARTNFHMKGLASADAVNKIYQNTLALQKKPAWLAKLENSRPPIAQSRMNGSQNHIVPRGLTGSQNNIAPYAVNDSQNQIVPSGMMSSQNHMVPSVMNGSQNQLVQNRLHGPQNFPLANGLNGPRSQMIQRQIQIDNFKNYHKKVNSTLLGKNPHSPAWFGNPPNKNIVKSNPSQFLDLTDDANPPCDVCDDDFNWPDENHICPRNQNKKMKLEQPTNSNESNETNTNDDSEVSVPMQEDVKEIVPEKEFIEIVEDDIEIVPERKKKQIDEPRKINNLDDDNVVEIFDEPKSVNIPDSKKKQNDKSVIGKIPSSTKVIPINNTKAISSTKVIPIDSTKATRASRTTRSAPLRQRTPSPDTTRLTRRLSTRSTKTTAFKPVVTPERTVPTRTMPSRRVKNYGV